MTKVKSTDNTIPQQENGETALIGKMRKDEEGLYLENVKTGKVYEFVLREVAEESAEK